MNISSVTSSYSAMAETASSLKSGEITSQIAVNVMKNILDNQEQVGQSIVQMIEQSAVTGTGGLVDVRA